MVTTIRQHHIDGPNAAGLFWVFGPHAARGELFATRADGEAFAHLVAAGDLASADELAARVPGKTPTGRWAVSPLRPAL